MSNIPLLSLLRARANVTPVIQLVQTSCAGLEPVKTVPMQAANALLSRSIGPPDKIYLPFFCHFLEIYYCNIAVLSLVGGNDNIMLQLYDCNKP